MTIINPITIPTVGDVTDLHRRFSYLHTLVGSWVRDIPTLAEAQLTYQKLQDLEMDCTDFDLSQKINWLFIAISRVLDAIQHPDFDPDNIEVAGFYLQAPASDPAFKNGLQGNKQGNNLTLIYIYAIWEGRKDRIGRARKIGAELRRRERAKAKQKADE